jgi:hypothetical protein
MIKKIFFLLSFAEKIIIFLLSIFSNLISLLELIAIFALFLFINFLSKYKKTNYNFTFDKLIDYFSLDLSYDQLTNPALLSQEYIAYQKCLKTFNETLHVNTNSKIKKFLESNKYRMKVHNEIKF